MSMERRSRGDWIVRGPERRQPRDWYLRDCTARIGWPRHGLYIFFDDAEPRRSGPGYRIVRIGTHGVSATSKSTLWDRLRQHRGQIGGAHAGGGNHRGSVFRLHVGAALLKSGNYSLGVQSSWGKGGSAPSHVMEHEEVLERAVSNYIGSLPTLWLAVPGLPEERAWLERNLIGLASAAARQRVEIPSSTWLGRLSERHEILSSGLWNVNCVEHRYDPAVIDEVGKRAVLNKLEPPVLARMVSHTIRTNTAKAPSRAPRLSRRSST